MPETIPSDVYRPLTSSGPTCRNMVRSACVTAAYNVETSTTISVRADESLVADLDQLADALDRNRNWVINEAIANYVELQRWQLQQIQKGVADSDAGRTVPHKQVRARMERLMQRGIKKKKPA